MNVVPATTITMLNGYGKAQRTTNGGVCRRGAMEATEWVVGMNLNKLLCTHWLYTSAAAKKGKESGVILS